VPTAQFVNPSHFAPPVGPYSQAVCVGDMVFLSGQAAVDLDNNVIAPGDVAEQTRVTLARMRDILAELGAGLDQIVTATVFITDTRLFGDFNMAWEEVFGTHRPARATVRTDLMIDGLLVEIQSIAQLAT
jgi:2-iminobutanoate/2-iminopropanoate deaminase